MQILPGDQNHQTISGPDKWVMLDNGDARRNAAWTFLKWFTSPAQAMKWSLATGDLPIRASQAKQPDYQTYVKKYPGIATFVQNEQNAVKARPVLADYNEISQAMGQAIQAVLLGKAQPQQALAQAAAQVNQVLAPGRVRPGRRILRGPSTSPAGCSSLPATVLIVVFGIVPLGWWCCSRSSTTTC